MKVNQSSVSKKACEGIAKFLRIYENLEKSFISDKLLSDFIEDIIHFSELDEYYKDTEENEDNSRIENLQNLKRTDTPYKCTSDDLKSFLDTITLERSIGEKENTEDAVILSTLHNTKGLEFNNVIITGLEEGVFPYGNKSGFEMEEERRLFYVGCTRAEKVLYLYYAQCRFYQGISQKYPMSRFLRELDPSVVDCEQIVDNEGFGVGFNQDSSFPRYNKAPDFVRKANVSANRGNSYSSTGFRSGFGRTSSVPASVKKNDQRIVYHNPIKVDKPAVSGGMLAANNEHGGNPYHPGARVQHVKFGVGTILRCSGSGDEARIEIRFSRDGGIRTLIAKYVKIVS